jgi:hypothetical protein
VVAANVFLVRPLHRGSLPENCWEDGESVIQVFLAPFRGGWSLRVQLGRDCYLSAALCACQSRRAAARRQFSRDRATQGVGVEVKYLSKRAGCRAIGALDDLALDVRDSLVSQASQISDFLLSEAECPPALPDQLPLTFDFFHTTILPQVRLLC